LGLYAVVSKLIFRLPGFGADVGSAHLEHIHKCKFGADSFLPLIAFVHGSRTNAPWAKKTKSLRMRKQWTFSKP
jgi:hypothetical protein